MSKKIRLLAGSRQKGESSKAVQACNDYLRMGPGRSLFRLIEKYNELEESITVPTRAKGTVNKWSADYAWQERAESYDVRIEEQKNKRAEEIMNSGLALEHERTKKLKELYALLEKQLFETDPTTGVLHNLWLKDYKSIGQGEALEIERFNAPLIREIRATLDDIAAETGGRVRQVQAKSLNIDLDSLTNEELTRVVAGEDITLILAQRGQKKAT